MLQHLSIMYQFPRWTAARSPGMPILGSCWASSSNRRKLLAYGHYNRSSQSSTWQSEVKRKSFQKFWLIFGNSLHAPKIIVNSFGQMEREHFLYCHRFLVNCYTIRPYYIAKQLHLVLGKLALRYTQLQSARLSRRSLSPSGPCVHPLSLSVQLRRSGMLAWNLYFSARHPSFVKTWTGVHQFKRHHFELVVFCTGYKLPVLFTDFIHLELARAGKTSRVLKTLRSAKLAKASSILERGQRSAFVIWFRSRWLKQDLGFPSFLLLSPQEATTLRWLVQSPVLSVSY